MGGNLASVDLGADKKAVAVIGGERPPYYVVCDPLILSSWMRRNGRSASSREPRERQEGGGGQCGQHPLVRHSGAHSSPNIQHCTLRTTFEETES